MVWFWRDKRVDADLKPPRFVDGLVPTVGGAEACFCSSDVESTGRIHQWPCSSWASEVGVVLLWVRVTLRG